MDLNLQSSQTQIALIVVAGMISFAWFVMRRRWKLQHFEIQIEQGKATVLRGKVDKEFLADIERICTLWNVTTGQVTGKWQGDDLQIRCAGEASSIQLAIQNAVDNPL